MTNSSTKLESGSILASSGWVNFLLWDILEFFEIKRTTKFIVASPALMFINTSLSLEILIKYENDKLNVLQLMELAFDALKGRQVWEEKVSDWWHMPGSCDKDLLIVPIVLSLFVFFMFQQTVLCCVLSCIQLTNCINNALPWKLSFDTILYQTVNNLTKHWFRCIRRNKGNCHAVT